jgi:predicted TIM-barrel fold metal-dependent hydrolase
VFPVQRYWSETFIEDHLLTFPVEGMWHLGSMLFQGIPERFPGLEFVMQETGVEWLPWMMWRMDDHYLQNSQDVPILTKPPSEYLADQFYFTTMPLGHTNQGATQAAMIDAAGGEGSVMFASDHPHPDLDLPDELLQPLSGTLPDETIERILGGTAATLFGF